MQGDRGALTESRGVRPPPSGELLDGLYWLLEQKASETSDTKKGVKGILEL